jgi:hypothetical protein
VKKDIERRQISQAGLSLFGGSVFACREVLKSPLQSI